ncbi:MAG TPA: ABC transporter permease [Thermoanaerobaculia bacterium]|nr:ABC transporter permease [Thermoanaerobaculia bacterium]
MQKLLQDLTFALRQLRRNPGFTAATVLTLALGIGVNTAIFSIVSGVLLRPLPFREGDRLVQIKHGPPEPGAETVFFSVPEVFDYRAQSRALADWMEYHSMAFTLLGYGEPDRVRTAVVSANALDVLGVQPALGRPFRPEDDLPGAPPVLLLSDHYWRSRIGGDPAIVGRTLRMNDKPITVIGVLPPLPPFPGQDDVYMPTSACPFRSGERLKNSRTARLISLFGRLPRGGSLAAARTEVTGLGSRLRQAHPEAYPGGPENELTVIPAQDQLIGSFRPTLFLLLGTVGLVLLIACANVGNLALARLLAREREVVLRSALGAGRGRLIRQMLTESTVLALVGGALGLLFAALARQLLVAFALRFTPLAAGIGIDLRVLAFTLAVSLLTGLAFGLLPALHASRRDLAGALKQGGHATSGRGRHGFRNALVVLQVAVSFVLLIAAGLTVRSSLALEKADPGFANRKVLTATLSLPFSRYRGAQKTIDFYGSLLPRVAALPGVTSAALGSSVPLTGGRRTPNLLIEGRNAGGPGQPEIVAAFHLATPEYFRTLGVPLVAGRAFLPSDDGNALPVAIINRSMSHHYWPGESPIGKRFALPGASPGPLIWVTIVGVVGDVKQEGLSTDEGDAFYFPFAQTGGGVMSLFVQTASAPLTLLPAIRNAVREVDPDTPVSDASTLEEAHGASAAPARLTAVLLLLFGSLAFVVTAMGLAAVIAFSVTERTQEIGIRAALGAGRGQVLAMVLGHALALVVSGLALGAVGALAASRLLASLLYEVRPTDPMTFAISALLLLAVVGAACYVPARRAVGIDPSSALRS